MYVNMPVPWSVWAAGFNPQLRRWYLPEEPRACFLHRLRLRSVSATGCRLGFPVPRVAISLGFPGTTKTGKQLGVHGDPYKPPSTF